MFDMESLIKEKEATIDHLKKKTKASDGEVKVLKEKIAEQNELNKDLMRQLRDMVLNQVQPEAVVEEKVIEDDFTVELDEPH